MKRLIFAEGLLAPVIQNDKTLTIRRYRSDAHDFVKNEVFIGKFKDGFDIRLTAIADTEIKTFADLTHADAEKDGFESVDDAINGLRKYYQDLELTDQMAIIRFEVYSVDDVPAIAFNEHSE